MRRLFWAGVGAAGAVLAARRVRRVTHRFTPDGVAEQVSDTGARVTSALRVALAEFRDGYRSRQEELVVALLAEPEEAAARRPREHASPDDEPLYEF